MTVKTKSGDNVDVDRAVHDRRLGQVLAHEEVHSCDHDHNVEGGFKSVDEDGDVQGRG